MMAEHIITFDGKPYFLSETEKGVFHAVKQYTPNDDGEYLVAQFDEDLGKLVAGLDIKEVPNRGLKLLLEVTPSETDFWAIHVAETCRKLAAVADCDYVSIEKYGPCMSRVILRSEHVIYNEVTPRLFRKIVNN